MNLGIKGIYLNNLVRVFTLVWLLGSVLICGIFSFFILPDILDDPEGGGVQLYFFTNNPGGDFGTGEVYLPNRGVYRQKYLESAIESDFLFFKKCDLIKKSERPKCDSGRNWSRVPLNELGCVSLDTCVFSSSDLSPLIRKSSISDVVSIDGSGLAADDIRQFSFDDPKSWGPLAPFLMFILTFFACVSAGRTLGEFMFKPYVRD